ncbi:MAG: VIT and VWA domain-containing protein [Firmicutes bacterium]|nr:VIT and VWA domain-containing protein [Bacillota bacterium]
MMTNGILNKKSGKLACPLKSVAASAKIDSTMAEVTLVQNYQHEGKGTIEALYTFPLPPQAQVTGFSAKIGETELVGEFREKEEAFKEYDHAIRQGDSAFLLESHRPDIFQLSLGNIAAGEYITITLTYLEDVKCVDNELRWVLPTVVAPRYIPGKKAGKKMGTGVVSPTDRVPDADFITPPVGDAPYTLRVRAEFTGIEGVKKISSPSHPLEVQMQGETFIVTLAKETELLDSDFILTAMLEKTNENSLYVAEMDEQTVIGQARFKLELEQLMEAQKNYEYTFLIDVSGSMAGEKLEQAKRALGISLRNLVQGDWFTIVAFESSHQSFSPRMVPYTQENLNKADHWIELLTARGGTEILEPLQYVLQNGSDHTLDRVVLLFTDGQVGNEDEIIKVVGRNNHGLSLFTFGIDTAVNRYFIDRLAAVGNGMPEYVYPGERIEDKVIRQFSRIHLPYVSDPYVVGSEGRKLETVPALPARLYHGEEYHFTVLSEKLAELTALFIRGETNGVQTELQLRITRTGDARLLSLHWAKEKIKMLEEGHSGSNPRREKLSNREIVELSIKYGVMSTRTALVAVYKRENKEKGMMETIVVPVAKPRGWEMLQPSLRVSDVAAPPIMSYALMADEEEMPFFAARSGRRSTRKVDAAFVDKSSAEAKKVRSKEEIDELVRRVAQKQNADGTFGSGREVASKTAYFIIAMLLLQDEWKPYRTQLRKAGSALLGLESKENLLLAIALGMIDEFNVMGREDVRSQLYEISDQLDDEQKAYLKAFQAGDHQILESVVNGKNGKGLIASLLKKVLD